MRITLFKKIAIFMFAIAVIPLSVVGYLTIRNAQNIGQRSIADANKMGEAAIVDSTASLSQLGEYIIKQKAEDTAKQVDIYLKAYPNKTLADLQNDEAFKAIAVQPVYGSGYTYILDLDSAYYLFHPQSAKVGTDAHALQTVLPAVWGILETTITTKQPSAGYYDWKEADGTINQKFMATIASVEKTADGRRFLVGASTYIKDFTQPSITLKTKLSELIQQTSAGILAFTESMIVQIIVFTLVVIILLVIISFIFARSISLPIKKLKSAADKVTMGNFDVKLPEAKGTDEVADLTSSMEMLISALKNKK